MKALKIAIVAFLIVIFNLSLVSCSTYYRGGCYQGYGYYGYTGCCRTPTTGCRPACAQASCSRACVESPCACTDEGWRWNNCISRQTYCTSFGNVGDYWI